jgi:hypothetical protein
MKFTPRMAWLVAALLVGGMRPCSAATGAPPAGSAVPGGIEGAVPLNANIDLIESSRLLDPVYKVETEGFRLAPPAGSTIRGRGDVDLMSFTVLTKNWGGSLELVKLAKVPWSLKQFLESDKTELNKTFKGVQVLQEKLDKFGQRPAARIDLTMEAQLSAAGAGAATKPANPNGPTITLFRQQLIVQIDPDESGLSSRFVILTLYAPLKDRTEATRTFSAMLDQFELFDPQALKKRRTDAIAAGKAWLAEQSAEKLKGVLIREPQWFRAVVGGKDVGFLRFDELAQEPDPKTGRVIDVEREKYKGILELITSRSFRDDSAEQMAQIEAFWGFAKGANGAAQPSYSTWTNLKEVKSKAAVPSGPARAGRAPATDQVGWVQETGVLTQVNKAYQMVVAMTGDRSEKLPEGLNKVIPAEAAAPLPRILDFSWTRLVQLSKPMEMTFTAYDSQSNKLALRNLIVTGQKDQIPIDGTLVSCYRCIDELDPGSTTIWVDNTGRIQTMRTSDQSLLIPTTEAFLRTKWGARLNPK